MDERYKEHPLYECPISWGETYGEWAEKLTRAKTKDDIVSCLHNGFSAVCKDDDEEAARLATYLRYADGWQDEGLGEPQRTIVRKAYNELSRAFASGGHTRGQFHPRGFEALLRFFDPARGNLPIPWMYPGIGERNPVWAFFKRFIAIAWSYQRLGENSHRLSEHKAEDKARAQMYRAARMRIFRIIEGAGQLSLLLDADPSTLKEDVLRALFEGLGIRPGILRKNMFPFGDQLVDHYLFAETGTTNWDRTLLLTFIPRRRLAKAHRIREERATKRQRARDEREHQQAHLEAEIARLTLMQRQLKPRYC